MLIEVDLQQDGPSGNQTKEEEMKEFEGTWLSML